MMILICLNHVFVLVKNPCHLEQRVLTQLNPILNESTKMKDSDSNEKKLPNKLKHIFFITMAHLNNLYSYEMTATKVYLK